MGPGTTCWPGGVLKCSPGVGGSKMASRGVELLLTPPTPTYDLEALIQSTTPLRALFLPWYPMVSFIRFDPADWKLPGDNQRGWNSVFKVTRVIHIARYFLYVRTVQKWIELT